MALPQPRWFKILVAMGLLRLMAKLRFRLRCRRGPQVAHARGERRPRMPRMSRLGRFQALTVWGKVRKDVVLALSVLHERSSFDEFGEG